MRPLVTVGGLKKTRVRQGGALTVEDAHDILAQEETQEQVARNMGGNGGGEGSRPATIRRCGRCGEPGHNTRTCRVEEPMSNVNSSN